MAGSWTCSQVSGLSSATVQSLGYRLHDLPWGAGHIGTSTLLMCRNAQQYVATGAALWNRVCRTCARRLVQPFVKGVGPWLHCTSRRMG
jgi:hypothetical protein